MFSRVLRPLLPGRGNRTESFTVSVLEQHGSTRVTVSGFVDDALFRELVAVVETSSEHKPTVAELSYIVPTEVPTADRLTSDAPTVDAPIPARVGLPLLRLFREGAPPIPILGTVVVGRDPKVYPSDGDGAQRVVINDGAVSKTHAAIGIDANGLWIEDRHSTNGTRIVENEGQLRRIESGVRYYAVAPIVVVFAQYQATIR